MHIPRPEGVKKTTGLLAGAGTMGMHLVAGPATGFAVGYFLDGWLGTDPWLKGIFFVFGVISGFKLVYEDARKLIGETRETRDRDLDPSD